jgi:hypothetical protein
MDPRGRVGDRMSAVAATRLDEYRIGLVKVGARCAL